MTTAAIEPAKLLIVDDRPENLLAMQAVLERPEYRIFTARSGREALELALQEDFTVILLDVRMPGMSGFEVADHLKELERTRHIPIMFLTAVETEIESIYRAYDVGAIDYLIKPLDAKMVRKKVAVLVELVRAQKEVQRQAKLLRDHDRREYELRLAEARAASDERYRKMLDGIDHVVGWSAEPGTLRLTFISKRAQEILGYPFERFIEPGFWLEHVHREDRELVRATCARAVASGADQACNHRFIAGGERELWLHTGVSAMPRADGEGLVLQGVSVEVTPLKEETERQSALTQRAEQATEARDIVLAVVAHDLRNPLAAVKLSATSLTRLIEAGRSGEALLKPAAQIERSARRMERLIDDLLEAAALDAGTVVVNRRPVEAAPLIRDCVDEMEPLLAARSQRVVPSVPEGLWLACDRQRTLQILENLIGNASKFSPEGSAIRVAVARRDHEVVLSVADEGPGIAEAELPHLFDRFWKGRPQDRVGVGLGLSIVRGLAQAQGGRVWVESPAGAGATFSFALALADGAG